MSAKAMRTSLPSLSLKIKSFPSSVKEALVVLVSSPDVNSQESPSQKKMVPILVFT
ncbi:hypothetical protein [Allomuricauda sp. SCSIO 65647]|uniref:hypothetical protein n=1 Tax=Allomuricauda sp. SCSIO 65647 TaxID=2908843 RepID=UPI001F35BD85|nr:hypothetical protein [Muricauda sp. SCSIO 65647]UJH68044.1 hypothetical protein L0P89_02235 [Muricauda sp. SCSIO 65647]